MRPRCSDRCSHGEPEQQFDCSYILPMRLADPFAAEEAIEELASYLALLVGWCAEVIVIDGSPAGTFTQVSGRLPAAVRHVAPDPRHESLMGKVAGVLTVLDLAEHEAVIVADDDVRYSRPELARVVELLADHDLVRPQNYFAPLPWHAVWDTARTLLNRSFAADFPGTLGVRRSLLLAAGGYDGDVLFENLELIRTIEARGGTAASPLDLYVRRLPPSTRHFLGQRTRQAYDDFAIPARMGLWLLIAPAVALSLSRRRAELPLGVIVTSLVLAEFGRRRAGGAAVFPARSTLLAPAWVGERAVCSWLAVLQRVLFGGVRYRDSVIPTAAHSVAELRRRGRMTEGRSRRAECPPAILGEGASAVERVSRRS